MNDIVSEELKELSQLSIDILSSANCASLIRDQIEGKAFNDNNLAIAALTNWFNEFVSAFAEYKKKAPLGSVEELQEKIPSHEILTYVLISKIVESSADGMGDIESFLMSQPGVTKDFQRVKDSYN